MYNQYNDYNFVIVFYINPTFCNYYSQIILYYCFIMSENTFKLQKLQL
jgi:hypothetical protein